MIYDIFQILLWVTAIMLTVSGLDDLYLDICYWLLRNKYKSKLPDTSRMHEKEEKPIAIMLGAWKEASVIGRTLSYAVRNLKYQNYRIFVGVYPNDPDTLRVVKEISRKDNRVIACINPQNGPTTKADNLNSIYAGICEYEKVYGEFEVIVVHDAEDFIHPLSLKLENFLLGYKGYHAIQIPVIPIKSKLGKLIHRTYCDAFAEVHTKDLIVRQGMGTFIPFAGTGMAFHRKAIAYLEKHNRVKQSGKYSEDPKELIQAVYKEEGVRINNDFFENDEEKRGELEYINDTEYHDDPFQALNGIYASKERGVPGVIKNFTFLFFMFVISGVGFLAYTANQEMQTGSLPNDSYARNERVLFVSNAYAAPTLDETGKNSVPQDEFISVKDAFKDRELDAFYLYFQNGKIGIQESMWSNEQDALNHIGKIYSVKGLEATKVTITHLIENGKGIYKVIISEFDSLEQARHILKVIRNSKTDK